MLEVIRDRSRRVAQWVQHHPTTIAFVLIVGALAFLYHGQQQQIDRLDTVDHRTVPFNPISHVVNGIENRIPGIVGPAIHRGDTVIGDLTLCNKLNRTVDGTAGTSWQALGVNGQPLLGQAATIYSGVPSQRYPGCVRSRHTQFVMPESAVVIDQNLDAAGTPHSWRLVGSFIPTKPDGTFGVRDLIVSRPITVVP